MPKKERVYLTQVKSKACTCGRIYQDTSEQTPAEWHIWNCKRHHN